MSIPNTSRKPPATDAASAQGDKHMASEPDLHNVVTSAARAKGRSPATVAEPDGAGTHESVLADLRRLEHLFTEVDWPERRTLASVRKRARARAAEVLETCRPSAEIRRAVLLAAAVELLVGLESQLVSREDVAAGLVDEIETVIGIPRVVLAREVLRAPELMSVSPAAAVEAQLTMLFAFGPLRGVSLWKLDEGEQATCAHHVGEGEPSRRVRQLAQRVLSSEENEEGGTGARTLLLGLPVGRWQEPLAALVATAKPWARDHARTFLVQAVPIISAVLERELLLSGNAASERALVESSERKLTRLGFDLHDGPIQDVAMLAEDLRLFRDQLEMLAGPLAKRKVVRARFEDLEAQLVGVDAELRRLSGEVQSASVLLNRPFRRALADRCQAFAARTDIEPKLTLRGDARLISSSQQIALLNIIHEALNNIREHADATAVQVSLSVDQKGVRCEISDNGKGFDLEATLMRTARQGRVGLVAMNERVRLLGGQCRIETRPGGPTTVSVSLARWRPALGSASGHAESA